MKSLLTTLTAIAIGTSVGNLTGLLNTNGKINNIIDLSGNLSKNNNPQITEQESKIDLNTITQLNGLDIIANPSKIYKELISNINSFDEFKSKPLATGYQLQFYNENKQEITNNKQELEKVSKISVKIISSLNDKSYQGSTIIDITKQTNISDIDMQNYFKKKTLPFASLAPSTSTKATSNKIEALSNIITQLKKIQKETEIVVKLLLKGMYKEKIDFNKLSNENEIYDVNQQPVPSDWFEHQAVNKEAKILIFYGNTETGYFYPIKININ